MLSLVRPLALPPLGGQNGLVRGDRPMGTGGKVTVRAGRTGRYQRPSRHPGSPAILPFQRLSTHRSTRILLLLLIFRMGPLRNKEGPRVLATQPVGVWFHVAHTAVPWIACTEPPPDASCFVSSKERHTWGGGKFWFSSSLLPVR